MHAHLDAAVRVSDRPAPAPSRYRGEYIEGVDRDAGGGPESAEGVEGRPGRRGEEEDLALGRSGEEGAARA